jgi:hypothetical protein
MSETIYVIACTEADMLIPPPPQPRFAKDGSCAHRESDLMNRCRMCAVEMTEEALDHRAQSWFDSI